MPRKDKLPLLAAACLLAGLAAPAWAQEGRGPEPEQRPPPVTLVGIAVEPESPGPDTLCRLAVEVRNGGDRIASLFGFSVAVGGRQISVYERELFAFPVAPGETAELRLFNFWSTETSRPPPAGDKLDVEVRLEEARWMEIETEEGAQVWTPVGAVEGLPVATSVTLKLRK